jgi:hypothetical protein
MKSIDQYKVNLAKAIRTAIVQHIAYTPEKETIFIEHTAITGELSIWIDGKYKVAISHLCPLEKEAQKMEQA